MSKHEGDDNLSSFEISLWQLHQHILHKWGIYTIFRWHRPHVPLMKEGLIEWFVPADATFAYEIRSFIEGEAPSFEFISDSPDYPSTRMKVITYPFSFVKTYLTHEEANKITSGFTALFRCIVAGQDKIDNKQTSKLVEISTYLEQNKEKIDPELAGYVEFLLNKAFTKKEE